MLLPEPKKRELSEQQKQFLDFYFGEAEGDPYKACELANYSKNSAPSVIRNLKEEIIERAEIVLAMYAPKAAHTLGRSLGDGATEPGANVRLQAAEKILDRVGLSKKEQLNINAQVANALFIIPAKQAVQIEGSDESGN